MSEILGKIHSIETCGTVDGPGIRFVVFTQGCPMRCQYCHNPDSWGYESDNLMSVEEILSKYNGVKEFCTGGITVTGGEPLVQIDFVTELFKKAQEKVDNLKEYCISDIGIAKTKDKNDMYRFNTSKLELFSEIWRKWYEKNDNKYYKHYIPNDLKLTPLMCLIWYIGDGGLRTRTKQRNYPSQTLSLATNNFKKECIEDILVPQLSIFDAYIEPTANKEQYLITIPRRKIEDFLDYIGECPFDDYKYKWNVIPYQRTKANDSIIIDLYNNGYTYTEMQRITGCGRTTLVTHIKDLKDKNIVIWRHD